MTFRPIEIDACPAYGWQGGPNADVLIRALKNRHERRNRRGDLMLHSYTLPFQNIPSEDYLQYIKAAFMALGGPHDSFLVKDYGDFNHGINPSSAAMPFATTDGTTEEFQLTKTYTFTDGITTVTYARPITKPYAGHVIYLNGVDTGFGADPLTGIVDFGSGGPPAGGQILSWTGEFRVPVRFADFYLPSTLDSRVGTQYAANGSCTLTEVPGE